jgi:hypothetical protein
MSEWFDIVEIGEIELFRVRGLLYRLGFFDYFVNVSIIELLR